MSILSTDLVKLVQELSQHLSQYESSYATLQERMEALERELRDRTALVDAFALVSETDTRASSLMPIRNSAKSPSIA